MLIKAHSSNDIQEVRVGAVTGGISTLSFQVHTRYNVDCLDAILQERYNVAASA